VSDAVKLAAIRDALDRAVLGPAANGSSQSLQPIVFETTPPGFD
jgi:hypothetical protein